MGRSLSLTLAAGPGPGRPSYSDVSYRLEIDLIEAGPRWAARGPAFSAVVGDAFPRFHLDQAQLDLVREALAGDVPTVLRREWEDELDDRT